VSGARPTPVRKMESVRPQRSGPGESQPPRAQAPQLLAGGSCCMSTLSSCSVFSTLLKRASTLLKRSSTLLKRSFTVSKNLTNSQPPTPKTAVTSTSALFNASASGTRRLDCISTKLKTLKTPKPIRLADARNMVATARSASACAKARARCGHEGVNRRWKGRAGFTRNHTYAHAWGAVTDAENAPRRCCRVLAAWAPAARPQGRRLCLQRRRRHDSSASGAAAGARAKQAGQIVCRVAASRARARALRAQRQSDVLERANQGTCQAVAALTSKPARRLRKPQRTGATARPGARQRGQQTPSSRSGRGRANTLPCAYINISQTLTENGV
jgi:hypothetical protein